MNHFVNYILVLVSILCFTTHTSAQKIEKVRQFYRAKSVNNFAAISALLTPKYAMHSILNGKPVEDENRMILKERILGAEILKGSYNVITTKDENDTIKVETFYEDMVNRFTGFRNDTVCSYVIFKGDLIDKIVIYKLKKTFNGREVRELHNEFHQEFYKKKITMNDNSEQATLKLADHVKSCEKAVSKYIRYFKQSNDILEMGINSVENINSLEEFNNAPNRSELKQKAHEFNNINSKTLKIIKRKLSFDKKDILIYLRNKEEVKRHKRLLSNHKQLKKLELYANYRF